jgi:hypothetical protein
MGNISSTDALHPHASEGNGSRFAQHIVHMGKVSNFEMIGEHQLTKGLAHLRRQSPALQ